MSTRPEDAVDGAGPLRPQYTATVGHINLGGTALGVISLDPCSGTAGVVDLVERCGWRPWDFRPGLMTADPGWVVSFKRSERALYQIGRVDEGFRLGVTLYEADCPLPIPEAIWGAMRGHRRVAICGGVSGPPNYANLTSAAAAGQLHAVIASRYFV
jgi:hypothetical protein